MLSIEGEEMISKALEEYLKTMYVLKKQNGNIRVTDIANKMNCSTPTFFFIYIIITI